MASLPYPRTLSGGAVVPTAPTKLHTHPKLLCVLRVLWENTIMAGGVGMAGMPYPPTKNSHRLHGCAQIRRQKRNLKICGIREISGRICEVCAVGARLRGWCSWGQLHPLNFCAFCVFCGRIRSWQAAWVWQGCHTLLQKLPQIARMCTD